MMITMRLMAICSKHAMEMKGSNELKPSQSNSNVG